MLYSHDVHAQVAPGGEGVVRWWGITSDVSTPGQVTWGDAPPVRPGGDGLGWVIPGDASPTYLLPPVTNTISSFYMTHISAGLRSRVLGASKTACTL